MPRASPLAGLLAGLLATSPLPARAGSGAPERASEPADAVACGCGSRAPTRLEAGAQLGDYVYAVGSPNQLRYAPAVDLRLAYGLPRLQGLGFVRLAAPLRYPGGIAIRQRQFSTGGGLGLRSMLVQHRWVRFGLWLAGTVDRLDSLTELPALPGLDEPGHQQKRVTHHAGVELGVELGVPLPLRRGPTTVLTVGGAVAFVFPIAASRRGNAIAEAHYAAPELGVVAVTGGATVLVNLGVMLGWDLERRFAVRSGPSSRRARAR